MNLTGKKTVLLMAVLLICIASCSNKGKEEQKEVYEDMKLVGITPAAYISPKDDVFMYGLMIPVSEISLSLQQLSR